MRNDNIFITGGEVSGDSMIGYKEKIDSLTRLIEQRLDATGGIYVYGLYRMGKSSLLKHIIPLIEKNYSNLICIHLDLNVFNTNNQNSYAEFLEAIILELEDKLDELTDIDLTKVKEKISVFKNDDMLSIKYRLSFYKIFTFIKKAGLKVLLVIDEFDSAKDVFTCKADFELFRELVASKDYSVCLVTVSRQELSLIENVNPNNSSFKGVMHPFQIKGFDNDDIKEYRRILEEFYNYALSDQEITTITYYSGSSPYILSCIGYEIADSQLLGKETCIEDILNSTAILSKIGGFHDSIFKCLENDKDRNGVNFAEKLASVIIGPSFLASNEDVKLLISMNYLIDTGTEYLAFSHAFKKYLIEMSYSNDVLNNFDMLEKKMKVLLENNKDKLFAAVSTSDCDCDKNWFNVLSDTWDKIESKKFNKDNYIGQINNIYRKFHKNETVLNVMSLEDVMRIVRNYWSIFSYKFNDDTLDKWEIKFKDCGTARNPVHHGSVKRIYTTEEQNRINSYCMEIINQLSK